MNRFQLLIATGGIVALGSVAAASPFNTHWGLSVGENGQLVTEGWQSGVGYLGESRVFAFNSQNLLGTDFFDIGTNSVGGTFATPGSIGFDFRSALQIWNGNGFDDAGVNLTAQFGPFVATSGTGFVPGFGTAVRDETSHPSNPAQWGRHHTHQDLFIDSGASDGIYLMEFSLWYEAGDGNPTSYADSDSFWVLFNLNGDVSEVSVAADWVQVNIVPTPGVLTAFGLAGLMATRRRR